MYFKSFFFVLACGASSFFIAPTTSFAAKAPVETQSFSPLAKALKRSKPDRRDAGSYKIARKKNKALKVLGIAAGVAATAIIVNEAARAERRRKKRARRARARHRSRHNCHGSLIRHRHRSLGGRYYHRHDDNCLPYRESVAPAPPPEIVRPDCRPGYEYVDGQCYLIDPDDRPRDDYARGDIAPDDRYRDDQYRDDGYRNGPAYAEEDIARCAQRYRSFRESDGTFQPYRGPRRLCPYLGD